jgi:hypothetical protein
VKLCPLGTPVTNGPIVPAPDDKWVWGIRWNESWQGKPKYLDKSWTNATLSTTSPIWRGLRSNPGRCGGKPITDHPSYGKSCSLYYWQRSLMKYKNKHAFSFTFSVLSYFFRPLLFSLSFFDCLIYSLIHYYHRTDVRYNDYYSCFVLVHN